MGEIDDIFAGKTKSKGREVGVKNDVISGVARLHKKKKKKSKKPSSSTADLPVKEKAESIDVAPSGKKRKQPETVVDPSLEVEKKVKKTKVTKEGKKNATVDSDDERFRDSRGTGPSK